MTSWFDENWWWVVPAVLILVVIALTVQKHRKIAHVPGANWRWHTDAAANTLLGAFALFLGYGAYASGWLIGVVPTIFMPILLYAPNRTEFTVPNWARYVGYLALLVLFVVAFPLKA